MRVYRMKPPYDQYEEAPFICTVYAGKETLDFACDNVYQKDGQVFVIRYEEVEGEGEGDEEYYEDVVAIFPDKTPYLMAAVKCYRIQDQAEVVEDYLKQQQTFIAAQKRVSEDRGDDLPGGDWRAPDSPSGLFD